MGALLIVHLPPLLREGFHGHSMRAALLGLRRQDGLLCNRLAHRPALWEGQHRQIVSGVVAGAATSRQRTVRGGGRHLGAADVSEKARLRPRMTCRLPALPPAEVCGLHSTRPSGSCCVARAHSGRAVCCTPVLGTSTQLSKVHGSASTMRVHSTAALCASDLILCRMGAAPVSWPCRPCQHQCKLQILQSSTA